MKLVLAIAMLWASQSFAKGASTDGSITCATQKNLPKNSFQASLTLTARVVRVESENKDKKKEEIILRNVTMTAKMLDSNDPVETGRAKTLRGALNPRARKYKEYYQVSTDSLVNTKDFARYNPLDQCSFQVNLPTNLWNKSNFEAPVVTHCDQNGGTQGWDCTFTPGK